MGSSHKKRKNKRKKKNKGLYKALLILLLITALVYGGYKAINYFPIHGYYTAARFGIRTLKSSTDYDNDGIDDYKDIMLGARAYIETQPTYNGDYYAGGYPPDGIGVCTDVIWHAFKSAGYSLKDLVDKDIKEHRDAYTSISVTDPNIDFRRVPNLKIFFERNASVLTLDLSDIKQWQPGDIVIFEDEHIAILSDRRNKDGLPYLIQHGHDPAAEEDRITSAEITGHYRWKK